MKAGIPSAKIRLNLKPLKELIQNMEGISHQIILPELFGPVSMSFYEPNSGSTYLAMGKKLITISLAN